MHFPLITKVTNHKMNFDWKLLYTALKSLISSFPIPLWITIYGSIFPNFKTIQTNVNQVKELENIQAMLLQLSIKWKWNVLCGRKLMHVVWYKSQLLTADPFTQTLKTLQQNKCLSQASRIMNKRSTSEILLFQWRLCGLHHEARSHI